MTFENFYIDRTLASRNMYKKLEYENYQFMMLVQATVGGIHPLIREIRMRCIEEIVHIYFEIDEQNEDVLEALWEIEAEWCAYQVTNVPFERHLQIGESSALLGEQQARPLYVRYDYSHA